MANNPKNPEEDDLKQDNSKQQKEMIIAGVHGKVKWFNVKRGYGFVCRNDNQEDVFIHQSAIVKSNPDHPRKSVGEGEEIQFDIVKGAKGNEASNVCGPDGNAVKGSEYALRYQRGGRGRYRGRGRGRGRSRGPSEDAENYQQDSGRGPPPPRGGGGGRSFRGGQGNDRPYMMPYRRPYSEYDMPPHPNMYYDFYREPFRGRDGFRGGRIFRGGPPREMNYAPYEYDDFNRRPRGDGGRRPRFGGRGRSWSGRGRGGPRDIGRGDIKDEGEEHQEEQHE